MSTSWLGGGGGDSSVRMRRCGSPRRTFRTSRSAGLRTMRCTMSTPGDSSSGFSRSRACTGSRQPKPSRVLVSRMADLLTVRDLKVYLDVDAGTVRAVDGVSFRIPAGRTVALVGESGSGKSVVAQSIMSILPRIARIESGEIILRDPETKREVDISRLDPAGRTMQDIRGGRISIIFQEPMTALSPLHTIGNQIGEALALHQEVGKREQREAVLEMLRRVGFPDPVKAE